MMLQPLREIDLVVSGAGVRGVGFVGSICALEEAGYTFRYVAGTSAGAIVASLLAVGYSGAELREIMTKVDYPKFKDRNWLIWNGLYKGQWAETWVRGLLQAKGLTKFSQLPPERLRVVASDLTTGKAVVMPHELAIDDIAQAVRMSMTIPFFFTDVVAAKNHYVDGGVMANYPINLLDFDPTVPTVGLKLNDMTDNTPAPITGPISRLTALFDALLKSQDQRHVHDVDWETRTIAVPTCGVKATDFDTVSLASDALYQAGYGAAQEFLATPGTVLAPTSG